MQFPIIFTDLDGTLLDHHNYSFDAALPVIAALKQQQIPIVATTSKTVQEVINLYESLDINGPFIVENGAAIYIPKNYFSQQPADTSEQLHFWVKSFSQPRSHFIEIVEKLAHQFGQYFTSFYQMESKDLAKVTGLSLASAKLASQRQYGEPVLWQGDNPTKRAFIDAARELGANVLEGGRFIHICGDCDKGKALNWLAGEFQHQYKLNDVTAIALGDSGNDNAMLEAADIAVQVKSPCHSFPLLNQQHTTFVYQTQGFGPVGCSEALNFILELPVQLNPNVIPNDLPQGGLTHG